MAGFRISLHPTLACRFSRRATTGCGIQRLGGKHLWRAVGEEHRVHRRSIPLEEVKSLNVVVGIFVHGVMLSRDNLSSGAGLFDALNIPSLSPAGCNVYRLLDRRCKDLRGVVCHQQL